MLGFLVRSHQRGYPSAWRLLRYARNEDGKLDWIPIPHQVWDQLSSVWIVMWWVEPRFNPPYATAAYNICFDICHFPLTLIHLLRKVSSSAVYGLKGRGKGVGSYISQKTEYLRLQPTETRPQSKGHFLPSRARKSHEQFKTGNLPA